MRHLLHRFVTKTVSSILPSSVARLQHFVSGVAEAGVVHFNRHSSLAAVRKSANFLLCLIGASFVILGSRVTEFPDPLLNQIFAGRPVAMVSCDSPGASGGRKGLPTPSPTSHQTSARLRLDPRALLFVDSPYSRTGRDIAMWLVANRIRYKSEVIGKSLPVLTYEDKGKFGVVIFENIMRYLNMDSWHRRILDRYMTEYHVGLIGFMPSSTEEIDPGGKLLQLGDFPIFYQPLKEFESVHLNPSSPVLRLTRAGDFARGDEAEGWAGPWFSFWLNHSSYTPVEFAFSSQETASQKTLVDNFPLHSKFGAVGAGVLRGNATAGRIVSVVQDSAQVDGVDRVLFGAPLNFWLHKLLFLDALSYLSRGRLSVPLTRYIQVDIDDIFVGKQGIRLARDDVVELMATQDRLRRTIAGFRYNLGFSGFYFHHGSVAEDEGDDMLIANAQEFWWFPHMWNHQQPHNFSNITQLMELMRLNRDFAEEHKLPVDNFYSIAPHHSGVYPVHEELYEAWREMWQIRVTATEEYPHLKPPRLRRGFIYRGIQVLPRQTCGLYTTNLLYDSYPGGKARLDSSIRGGELFQTIVANQFSVFMTHMSNYGNDRLGLYTFESVFDFLRCWTNLEFKTVTPLEMAERYFKAHPDERDPVWESPCLDKRHREIWSPLKTCSRLPNLLVLGPQKTGTTALYSFLSMHPSVASSRQSPETFEEVQFFSGKNYLRGLDWYMSFFPDPVANNDSSSGDQQLYLFEKSANYFDGELVPKRTHALVPKADLVVILISPAKRAHSWYHHQRAHDDPTALKYSFYEVITAKDTTNRRLRDLRNRCLYPGLYAHHLDRWLSYYPPQQLHIVDGEALKLNPIVVMNALQKELNITPFYDYANRLSYDAKKGFYCQLDGSKTKCLGKGKGRKYPPMDEKCASFLKRYYMSSNVSLEKLLKRLGYAIPAWLKDDLSEMNSEVNRVSPEG